MLSIFTGDNGQDPVRAELLDDATRLLAQGARVSSVADTLGISERHMRSLFNQTIGLAPKQFARISRVRTVATSIGHADLTDLAATAGYYDQAHDHRVPPTHRHHAGSLAAGQRPRPSPCHHRPQATTRAGTPNPPDTYAANLCKPCPASPIFCKPSPTEWSIGGS